jgi:methylenetetrahydrofolate dehydrogenase (NADP+)/methenyltetrahydrofolate cyclohydrolase
MESLVLDGRLPARELEMRLAERVRALLARNGGAAPALAVIAAETAAGQPESVRMKGRACGRVGVAALLTLVPATATTAEVLAEIARLNADPRVHGIFVQHPLPPGVDERRCFDAVALAKDVGGDSSRSFGRVALGTLGAGAFGAATPAAIMRLLAHHGIPLAGREAVVAGRSAMVGKPMAMMLLAADATVTVCHSRSRDLPALVGRAEILVGAVGRPHLIRGSWIRDGAVVIDAGFHPPGIGDIDLAEAAWRCAAYTPVPGGVGPMTIAVLLEHTVSAAERAVGTAYETPSPPQPG